MRHTVHKTNAVYIIPYKLDLIVVLIVVLFLWPKSDYAGMEFSPSKNLKQKDLLSFLNVK